MLEFGDTSGEVDVMADIGGKTGCGTGTCGATTVGMMGCDGWSTVMLVKEQGEIKPI